MVGDELSFPAKRLYADEYYNRIQNSDITNGAVYMAMSALEPLYSQHEAIAFPVTLELLKSDQTDYFTNELAAQSFKLILLDEDYRPKDTNSYRIRLRSGIWDATERPISIRNSGASPMKYGYFLHELRGEPHISELMNDTSDPFEFDS
jgi:hypothetical protein